MVHEALHLGDQVAVKEISPSASTAERKEARRLLMNECRSLSLTRHKNVVALLGICEDPPMLVMARAEKTLRQLLDEDCRRSSPTRLSLLDKLQLIHGVCQGMRALHARQLIHLDLKPQNILIAPGGLVPWVADLKLAVHENDARLAAPRSTSSWSTVRCG